jgi:hypothetical protein
MGIKRMDEINKGSSLNRREFIRRSLLASLACSGICLPLCRPKMVHAAMLPDIGESSLKSGGEKTWKTVADLDKKALDAFEMDLTPWEQTERDKKYPYVAAKLEPPYTATEIIYLLTVGQYFPWWTHESPIGGMKISNRGGINYYTGQREVWCCLTPDTLRDYLYQWPEDKTYLWAWDRYYTPVRSRGDKLLQNAYRTGLNNKKYSNKWSYSCRSQKTAPEGESLYSDRYWNMDYTYGDTLMVPWYYTWKFLGTDILYIDDAIRFPKTRTEIEIRNWGARTEKKNTAKIKLMGDDYPSYTQDGGVCCLVLEGTANPDFISLTHPKIILWVDIHAQRELRRERYDAAGNLAAVMEARYRLELKNKGKWGYSHLIRLTWDIQTDHLSADHCDFHRPPQTFEVDADNPETYFRPNPIAMCSEMFPVPGSTMVFRDPEQFYLRPKLMAGKFPESRKINIDPGTVKLINAQNKAQKLVFL